MNTEQYIKLKKENPCKKQPKGESLKNFHQALGKLLASETVSVKKALDLDDAALETMPTPSEMVDFIC